MYYVQLHMYDYVLYMDTLYRYVSLHVMYNGQPRK